MSGRAVVIIVMGIIIVSSFILINIGRSSTRITANFDRFYERQVAQNMAQSGVNIALRQLANNGTWRAGFNLANSSGFSQNNLLPGKNDRIVVTVRDTVFASDSTIAIISVGTAAYGEPISTSDTSIAYVRKRSTPPDLPSTLISNSPTGLAGNMTIDGRDHTITGNLGNPKSGVEGIFTTGSFSQGGGSTVGGTDQGTDYAPKGWPKNSKVIYQNQTLPNPLFPYGFPTTPDSVFGGTSYGYPEGTLKSIAMSGAGGSQYVTDPSNLTFPMQGVTYVELPSGASWSPSNFSGTGIVVVHNSVKNAILVNISSGSTFTGIVIGDDVIHIHNTIIGAVVTLTPAPSQGNVIGNGGGSLLFSRAAVKAAGLVLQSGGSTSISYWKEKGQSLVDPNE